MVLHVDSSAIAAHAARLERQSNSALPVVVRQTLNKAAYDVKQRTMPRETNKEFEKRKPTFFKAGSRVEQAKGFDINTMQSEVGFRPKQGDKSHSIEDLEQQEHGGSIKNRAFVAMPAARVGGSWGKNVRAKNRLDKMRQQLFDSDSNALHVKGKEAFVISALYAKKGGFILNQSHTRVTEVVSVKRVGRNTKVKFKTVESVKKGRQARVKATHFMRTASVDSAKNMERWFVELAEKKLKY